MQLPSREARYLGPATDPLTYSFPEGHKVWETAEGKVNQYATLVASNPLVMPSTFGLCFVQAEYLFEESCTHALASSCEDAAVS